MISFSGEMRTGHDNGANDDRWNCDLHDTLPNVEHVKCKHAQA